MSGDDLRRLRERRGLDRDDLAGLINQALGKNYTGETIARWERGRPVSKAVAAFLQELAVDRMDFGSVSRRPLRLDMDSGDSPDTVAGDDGPDVEAGDTAPGRGAPDVAVTPAPAPLRGSTAWTKACEDLWEMIATGVGMVGAVVGSPALVQDGAIIAADTAALGAAWGKLAETNETFRKMLVGMTEGGAWIQVAMVTGTTVSKCWQNHALHTQAAQAHREHLEGSDDGRAAEHAPFAA